MVESQRQLPDTPKELPEPRYGVLMTPQLAGVARTDLGASTGSFAEQRRVIVAAIDFLLKGF